VNVRAESERARAARLFCCGEFVFMKYRRRLDRIWERDIIEKYLVECRARIFVMGAGERAGGAPRTV
jgi:hypothetical protein